MADNKLPFALSFERQYAGPMDPTSTFATYAELQAYLQNPTCYPGQPVTCAETPGKIYIVNADSTDYDIAGGDLPIMSDTGVYSVRNYNELRAALSADHKKIFIIIAQKIGAEDIGATIKCTDITLWGCSISSWGMSLRPAINDVNYSITMCCTCRIDVLTWCNGNVGNPHNAKLWLNIHTANNISVTHGNFSERDISSVLYCFYYQGSVTAADDVIGVYTGQLSDWSYLQPISEVSLTAVNNAISANEIAISQLNAGKANNIHTHQVEDIGLLDHVLQSYSQSLQDIISGLRGKNIYDVSNYGGITGAENILVRGSDEYITMTTDALKSYVLSDLGQIYNWSDSGEDQILGTTWTLEGTLVGDKFDIVIRMAVSPVTGSSVDSLEIRPLAQFAGMRVHSKFLECIVTESTDAGSGTMGLLVYHFYQNNQHAYANQMSSLNEINESCYISNYNDTQSSSYYYNSGVLADANDIVFAFNGDGYWETRPVRRVKEYHYSGILLGTITPTEIPA